MARKCQALCSGYNLIDKAGRPCSKSASIRFKDGTRLCGGHARQKLISEAIDNKEVKIIYTHPSSCRPFYNVCLQ